MAFLSASQIPLNPGEPRGSGGLGIGRVSELWGSGVGLLSSRPASRAPGRPLELSRGLGAPGGVSSSVVQSAKAALRKRTSGASASPL
eukprot:12650233-Alexandrium_andersonii.AAC.1